MEKITVLWFCNSAANSDEFFNEKLKGSGGWIKSLDLYLQEHVNLHIVYLGDLDKKFKYKKTQYYIINNSFSFFKRFLKRITGDVSNKECEIKILDIINLVNPQIIHIHGTENIFGMILKHTSLPVVISVQGILNSIIERFFVGFDKSYLKINERSLSSLKNFLFPWSFHKEFKVYKYLQEKEKESLKLAKYVMGRTSWDKSVLKVLAPKASYFVDHRILRSSFYNRKWNPTNNLKFSLFTINGNSFYKGFEVICETIAHLLSMKVSFQWCVAGIGENDLIVKLTKIKMGLRYPEKSLILLGNLSEEELVNEMLTSDLYIMPSHIENNANNLCEAMTLGMPCVAADVGGMSSIITDKIDGFLFPDGDSLYLAGFISTLLNDYSIATVVGKKAREVSLHRHNPEIIVESLINDYKKIIEMHEQYK